MFTLLEFECLGACDRAPVVMVNNEHWHEKVDPESWRGWSTRSEGKGDAALTGCHLRWNDGCRQRGAQLRVRTLNQWNPVLTKYVREPNSFTLDFFLKHQGYDGLRKALGDAAGRRSSTWSRRRGCAAAAAPAFRPG